ncbi:hypothetical protein [Pseudoflavonifractor sp. 524-17]|uniref:hypothetical protein n=1 Tax=Pseudoflavonifractor sp. 524-17 TaxID=2304577 RepID=UPI00137A6286|nr:hypothetical protein [Pseudoflavonifractor sp. 524-17]
MDYSEVRVIQELTDWKEANNYLSHGWTLIHIYHSAYDTQTPGSNHQTPHYVLAWAEGEPVYPKPVPFKYDPGYLEGSL